MQSESYAARSGQIETYFDRVAADAWARLTSDVPRSAGIRATVRAGREKMRAILLGLLCRQDLRVAAAFWTRAAAPAPWRWRPRGAAPTVTAIDLSPTLIQLARNDRLPQPARCRHDRIPRR